MDNRILTLMICGGIMLLMYIAILALILTDLWASVRKAKKRGEFRTSPENPDPTAHFHELINFMDSDFKLPNGVTISNPSMARLEWLLWCQRHDRRFKGSVNPVVVE